MGKTWSRGTNSRLPFDVNVNLNLSIWQNNNVLGTCITLVCTFLCRHCTTTTLKCLISCFVKDVKTRERLPFFPWTLIQSFRIQLQEKFSSKRIWTRWNKRDKVWSSATSLFRGRFRIPCRRFCLSSPIVSVLRSRPLDELRNPLNQYQLSCDKQ